MKPSIRHGTRRALADAGTAGIVLQKIKRALKRDVLPFAGDADTMVTKVALLGGAGAGFMKLAKEAGAQLYLTGDIRYHDAQEAVKLGIVAADGGHFGTEYPVVQRFAGAASGQPDEKRNGLSNVSATRRAAICSTI